MSQNEDEVSLDEIFTRPSSTAIEVVHSLGPKSIYINSASLALSGLQLLDLLCEKLDLASKDCFPIHTSFQGYHP
jgi:hypothetical protein